MTILTQFGVRQGRPRRLVCLEIVGLSEGLVRLFPRVGSKRDVDGKGNDMLGSFEVSDGVWENVNEVVDEIVDLSGFNGIGACRHFECWADRNLIR